MVPLTKYPSVDSLGKSENKERDWFIMCFPGWFRKDSEIKIRRKHSVTMWNQVAVLIQFRTELIYPSANNSKYLQIRYH